MSVIKKNKEWLRTWHWVTKLTFYHNTVKGQPAESSLGLHDTVWKNEHERITGKLSKQKKNKKLIIWWWHCGCEFILRTCALRENLQSTGLMNIINHERALSDWLTGSAGAMLESNWVRVCELEERSLKVSHCWRDRAETCQQGGATPLLTQENRGRNTTTECPFRPLTVRRNPWFVLHCTVAYSLVSTEDQLSS